MVRRLGRLGGDLGGSRWRGCCGNGEALGGLAGFLMSPSLEGAET